MTTDQPGPPERPAYAPQPRPEPTPLAPAAPAAPAAPVRPTWAPPLHEARPDRLPSVRRAIAAIVILVVVFAAGVGVGRTDTAAPGGGGTVVVPASLPPEFATYVEAWQILHDKYVDPTGLDARTLTYGSIDGLVKAVGDTDHTRFLTPEDLAQQHTSLSGSIVGIGALMSTESGGAIIQSVIPGGPADRAGLRSGDHVLAVDGEPTVSQDIDTVVRRIRGDAGTTVKLSILHAGETAPILVSIVREKVVVPAVSWALVPGTTIADLRLEEFSTGSAEQVVEAIAAAKKAGAAAIVLDLRGNPGGYVNEMVSIASQFLADGDVYRQRDRTGTTTSIAVKPGGTATDIRLAVLVDLGSASSAEIVAGALQDAKRAQLIGKTTFGTGTVLTEFPLKDGSALLVGTIEWLTRDGRRIWKHGVVPDITLESNPPGKIVPPADFAKLGATGLAAAGDLQLLKAVELLGGN
jgi:carboxyl-terminal processing protease